MYGKRVLLNETGHDRLSQKILTPIHPPQCKRKALLVEREKSCKQEGNTLKNYDYVTFTYFIPFEKR